MSTERKDMRLSRGFWAGLLSFVIAKISHLLITFSFGLFMAIMYNGDVSEFGWSLIRLIDHPITGLIFLIFATRFVYRLITK
jgi:hypothetical protein